MENKEIVWGEPILVDGQPKWLGDDEVICAQWSGNHWYPHGPVEVRHTTHTPLTAIKLPADHFVYTAIAAGFEPWGGGDSAPDDWDGGEVLWGDGSVRSVRRRGSSLIWKRIQPLDHVEIIGYRKVADDAELRSDDTPPLSSGLRDLNSTITPPDFSSVKWNDSTFPLPPAGLTKDEFFAFLPESIIPAPTLDTITMIERMTEAEARGLAAEYAGRYYGGDLEKVTDVVYAVLMERGLIRPATPIEQFETENPGIVTDENRHWFELALEAGRKSATE